MVFLGDASNIMVFATANKGKKILRLNSETFFFEHRDGGGIDKWFVIGKGAIHIEDNGANFGNLVCGL